MKDPNEIVWWTFPFGLVSMKASDRADRQWMFTTIWKHFVVNKNKRGINANGYCVYRDPSGCRCILGVVMPDEVYDPSMEGWTFSAFSEANLDRMRLFFDTDRDSTFLKALQQTHDELADGEDLESGLRYIAKEYALEIPA